MAIHKSSLRQLRDALLELHKILIHSQKREYEKNSGKIESRAELYELVTNHKDFAWIRQLSELVIGVDEMLDNKQPPRPGNVRSLVAYTRKLLTISQTKTEFEKLYHRAVQQYPTVAIAHAAVMQLLRKLG
jgi:hypothetical protein